jgi:hypothetical protein
MYGVYNRDVGVNNRIFEFIFSIGPVLIEIFRRCWCSLKHSQAQCRTSIRRRLVL